MVIQWGYRSTVTGYVQPSSEAIARSFERLDPMIYEAVRAEYEWLTPAEHEERAEA